MGVLGVRWSEIDWQIVGVVLTGLTLVAAVLAPFFVSRWVMDREREARRVEWHRDRVMDLLVHTQVANFGLTTPLHDWWTAVQRWLAIVPEDRRLAQNMPDAANAEVVGRIRQAVERQGEVFAASAAMSFALRDLITAHQRSTLLQSLEVAEVVTVDLSDLLDVLEEVVARVIAVQFGDPEDTEDRLAEAHAEIERAREALLDAISRISRELRALI